MNLNATAPEPTPEPTPAQTPPKPGVAPLNEALPESLTEETYLAAEMERRREAMANAMGVAMQRLREAKSLKRWVRRYPWPTVGAAAAAGFTAATVVTPAKGEKLSDKLSRLASHTKHPPDSSAASSKAPMALAGAPFALMSIVHAMFDLAKILIERTAERPVTARENETAAAPNVEPPPHARE